MYGFYVGEIMCNVVFVGWLLFLNIIISIFFHFSENGIISFFMAEEKSLVYVHVHTYTHSTHTALIGFNRDHMAVTK